MSLKIKLLSLKWSENVDKLPCTIGINTSGKTSVYGIIVELQSSLQYTRQESEEVIKEIPILKHSLDTQLITKSPIYCIAIGDKNIIYKNIAPPTPKILRPDNRFLISLNIPPNTSLPGTIKTRWARTTFDVVVYQRTLTEYKELKRFKLWYLGDYYLPHSLINEGFSSMEYDDANFSVKFSCNSIQDQLRSPIPFTFKVKNKTLSAVLTKYVVQLQRTIKIKRADSEKIQELTEILLESCGKIQKHTKTSSIADSLKFSQMLYGSYKKAGFPWYELFYTIELKLCGNLKEPIKLSKPLVLGRPEKIEQFSLPLLPTYSSLSWVGNRDSDAVSRKSFETLPPHYDDVVPSDV